MNIPQLRILLGTVLLVLLGCADSNGDAGEVAARSASEPQQSEKLEQPVGTTDRSAAAADADEAMSEAEPVIPGIVAWWTRTDKLFDVEFPAQETAALSDHLGNLELSYQLAESQLRQARREQVRMLENPTVVDAEIESVHRERLQVASAAMLQANFSARLWVRRHLSADQLAAILKAYPTFFRVRWFRTARGPVVQGQVMPERKDAPE